MSTRPNRRHTMHMTLSECRDPGERRAGLGESDEVWNATVGIVVNRCGECIDNEASAAARRRDKVIFGSFRYAARYISICLFRPVTSVKLTGSLEWEREQH